MRINLEITHFAKVIIMHLMVFDNDSQKCYFSGKLGGNENGEKV